MIMAKVNNNTITDKEFDLACMDYISRLGKKNLKREECIAIINQLIDAKLLIEEALNSGFKASEDEVNQIFNNVKSNYKTDDEFNKALTNIGDTTESFKNKLYNDVVLKNYLDKEFYNKIDVNEEEVKKIYSENEDKFVTNDEINASHILIENKEEAEMVKNMILDGADFAETAKEYSICPSKNNGGSLGFFSYGVMVPEFEQAAFKLEVGEISDLIKTQFGYHIIKLNEKKSGKKLDYDKAKDYIIKQITSKEVSQQLQEKVNDLRKKSNIEMDQNKFDQSIGKYI